MVSRQLMPTATVFNYQVVINKCSLTKLITFFNLTLKMEFVHLITQYTQMESEKY